MNFIVRSWCTSGDRWDVTREWISIPFEQQDVRFHPALTNGFGAGAVEPSPLGGERTALTQQSECEADI